MDYLYTSLPPLCLVVLCMFVSVTVFSHAGDTCTVCRFPCPSRFPVLFFCLVVYENIRLPTLGHRPLFFLGTPRPYRDRLQPADIGLAGKLVNICQGDRSIEKYTTLEPVATSAPMPSSATRAWPAIPPPGPPPFHLPLNFFFFCGETSGNHSLKEGSCRESGALHFLYSPPEVTITRTPLP